MTPPYPYQQQQLGPGTPAGGQYQQGQASGGYPPPYQAPTGHQQAGYQQPGYQQPYAQPGYAPQQYPQQQYAQPQYGYPQQGYQQQQRALTLGQALQSLVHNAFNASGRAQRSEYWWAACMYFLLAIPIALGAGLGGVVGTILAGIGGLAYLLGIVAIFTCAIRRLHDTNKSGLFLLIGVIPLGGIFLLVFFCTPSDEHPNRYGPRPDAPVVY